MDDAYEGSYCTLRTPMQLHTPGMPTTQLSCQRSNWKILLYILRYFFKIIYNN